MTALVDARYKSSFSVEYITYSKPGDSFVHSFVGSLHYPGLGPFSLGIWMTGRRVIN